MTTESRQLKVQVWIMRKPTSGKPIEVLLFQVIPKRGGGWHPVTGSVEPHEAATRDFLAAAQRETREETGIDITQGKWFDLNHSFSFAGRFGPAQEHAFLFIVEGAKPKVQLDPHEHLDCRWVPIHDVAPALGFDSQRRGLERALERALKELSC